MDILVTGGCGYIGSVLVPKLLARGDRVTVVDAMWFGDRLCDHPRLARLQADVRDAAVLPMDGIDAVIHLANIANDPCGELDPRLAWEVNALSAMGLVERAVRCGVGRFLYASSGSVYGVKEEPEVTEDLELLPISDYNKTKMIAERVLLSYRDRILVQCVRPATVCGLSPRTRLDVSVNMLTVQAASRGRITVFGGDQTRPNIHIQDLTDVFCHLLDLGEKAPGIFNAGFENLSIKEIARRVAARVPAEIAVSASNDPRSYRLNADRLRATGFTPRHGVDEAIAEIAEAVGAGRLHDTDDGYNIRTMKRLIAEGRL